VQHHFSVWSTRLATPFQKQFEGRLQFLERALSEARDNTPRALRATALGSMGLPDAKCETAMVALECATICRDSHPDDFVALCAAMKIAMKAKLPVKAVELLRLLEFLAESDRIDPKIMPVDEVIGQVERVVAGQPVPVDWRRQLETVRHTIESSIQEKTKTIDALLARLNRLTDDSVVARMKADEGWADLMRQDLVLMNVLDRTRWELLLSHVSTVTPEPPAEDWDIRHDEIMVHIMDVDAYYAEHDRRFFSRNASLAWLETFHQRILAIGVEPFESLRLKWFHAIPDSRPGTLSQFSVWTYPRSVGARW
jgi:hypothetical protein